MKHKGYDECSEYEYYDIISYKHCSPCEFFFDNEKAQRFECLRDSEAELNYCPYCGKEIKQWK